MLLSILDLLIGLISPEDSCGLDECCIFSNGTGDNFKGWSETKLGDCCDAFVSWVLSGIFNALPRPKGSLIWDNNWKSIKELFFTSVFGVD